LKTPKAAARRDVANPYDQIPNHQTLKQGTRTLKTFEQTSADVTNHGQVELQMTLVEITNTSNAKQVGTQPQFPRDQTILFESPEVSKPRHQNIIANPKNIRPCARRSSQPKALGPGNQALGS